MKTFKAEQSWVVEVSDHEWFADDGANQMNILTAARENAKRADCTNISVFVDPDPMFPVYGVDRRKRVHNEQIGQGTKWVIGCTHHVDFTLSWWSEAGEKARARAIGDVKKVLEIKGRTNPGRYEIRVPNGLGGFTYIERGTVEKDDGSGKHNTP